MQHFRNYSIFFLFLRVNLYFPRRLLFFFLICVKKMFNTLFIWNYIHIFQIFFFLRMKNSRNKIKRFKKKKEFILADRNRICIRTLFLGPWDSRIYFLSTRSLGSNLSARKLGENELLFVSQTIIQNCLYSNKR